MTTEELLEALQLGEDQEIEFKKADGGLPKSIWETISAFANTEGGRLVLGISERRGHCEIDGIQNPSALIKSFWDTHNNPKKLNRPVCSDSDISVIPIDEVQVICLSIPRVSRQQRPVYINGNPFTGTYKRNFEGDYHCNEDEVRLMLRDAGNAPLDGLILDGFTLKDLDHEALSAYRNRFSSRDPDHPFLALNDQELLVRLGGWRRDRRTNTEGLTLAGILMFGTELSIKDALPNFHLDYQEQLSNELEVRWTFRIIPDGKWEPNLFNFYYRVYPRLVENIDVPFMLDQTSTRIDETHAHEALREALVNTLIHADHQISRPLKIIKSGNSFTFMNPGCLRIARDQLYQGGISDPRNPNLQKMFQLLGLGEKAGSGFQKILRAWREQHWMMPLVSENASLEMTMVRLPLISMIPEKIEQELRGVVGDSFRSLNELERIILLLAYSFKNISNQDIQPFCDEHPRDIGDCLSKLASEGWLTKKGHGRGMRYHWPQKSQAEISSEHLKASSEHLKANSEHLKASSEHLLNIAKPIRETKKSTKEKVEAVICELCKEQWLTLRQMAELLNRKPNSLRNHYINPMLNDGRLQARMPNNRNHPDQAYKAR